MGFRRVVVTAVAAAVAAVCTGAVSGSIGAMTPHAGVSDCPRGAVRASIAGRVRCLTAGQRCERRLDTSYHRARFHCHSGRLVHDELAPLYRSLHVQHLAPGTACPVTPADPAGALSRFGFSGTAWGTGPAYPATPSAATDHLAMTFRYPPPRESIDYGSEWSGQKVNWIVDPAYRRPSVFLIRGLQLDGSVELRFGRGMRPATQMILSGPGSHPSTTRLRASGCYAYQIDGFKFSKLIVFEARTVK